MTPIEWLDRYEAVEAEYEAAVAEAETVPFAGGVVPDKVAWAHDDALAELAHEARALFGALLFVEREGAADGDA